MPSLPSAIDSRATAINASGQVAGYAWVAGDTACLWQNGSVTNLGTLPGWSGSSYATGINDSGQVVGYAQMNSINETACLWQNGTVTNLGRLSGY